MDTKETLEVKKWEKYLMFAYLFGMADKVSKQLKNLYPEYIEQELERNNLDLNTLVLINSMTTRSVNAASAARSAAQSYSSVAVDFPQEAEEEAPLVEVDLPEVEEVDNTFFTENARNCIFFIYFFLKCGILNLCGLLNYNSMGC